MNTRELAPMPTLGPGNMFAQQPLWVGPIHEVDHRPGYCVGGSASVAGRVRLRVLRWDNRADETSYEDSQYGWATCYQIQTGEKHRLALEVLRVESTRPQRELLGLPARAVETLVQSSFRLTF